MADVSVITTAYNAERHLRAAIASILAQRGVDVEHVIVDDGSTDGTAAVVQSFADPRVRLVSAGRIGRGRALNLAIEQCRTDCIAVLDADDIAHPDRLRIEMTSLRARPDAVLVGSGQLLIGAGDAVQWPDAGGARFSPVNRALPIYNPLSHSSVMSRRSALAAVGGYDAGRHALFDWDLYVRLAAAGGTLLKSSVPLVAKRIHASQYFEGRQRAAYAAACLRLQWRSLRDLRRSRWLAAAFPLLHAYRLMPKSVRMAVRRSTGGVLRVVGRGPGRGTSGSMPT